jgi:hypothetical protein
MSRLAIGVAATLLLILSFSLGQWSVKPSQLRNSASPSTVSAIPPAATAASSSPSAATASAADTIESEPGLPPHAAPRSLYNVTRGLEDDGCEGATHPRRCRPWCDPLVSSRHAAFTRRDRLVRPQIAIVSVHYSAENNTYRDAMHKEHFYNALQYCQRHDYDLIIEDGRTVDPRRTAAWSKIRALQMWLPRYRWVVWMDADMLFMNWTARIEELIQTADEHSAMSSSGLSTTTPSSSIDIVLCAEWEFINSGFLLVRHSDWSIDFLRRIYLVTDVRRGVVRGGRWRYLRWKKKRRQGVGWYNEWRGESLLLVLSTMEYIGFFFWGGGGYWCL